jgi:diguanylate cyclase (GGDEF)-like protein
VRSGSPGSGCSSSRRRWFPLWLRTTGAISAFEQQLTRSGRFAVFGLAEPAVLAFAFASVVLLALLARRAGPLEGALVGALVASLAALVAGPAEEAGTLLFGAATAVMIAGLIQGASFSAYRDQLTGLPGRRAFDEELERSGRRFTIALVDIDHFKEFNDRWGHDAGDQVLRLVASRLARVGGGGRAFRHGGEEFAVLFPAVALKVAEAHLEKVRASIAAAGFTVRGADRPARKPATVKRSARGQPHLTVTVSIGVAERDARHDRAEAVVTAADAALYRAKAAGRNRLSR